MSEASSMVLESESLTEEAQRASLYTALVSCEISLKYALAESGQSVPKIHNLSKLLSLVSDCTVEDDVVNGPPRRVPASRIRSIHVDRNYGNATLGHLLQAESVGASNFPNEIRYGNTLSYYPAEVMQKASSALLSWVKKYAPSIKPKNNHEANRTS